jgi:creatinine amidohydrolase/Fe(II)-dependent formamide hydrolase-like protein
MIIGLAPLVAQQAQQPPPAGQGRAGGAAGGRQGGPPSMGGGQCANNPLNCPDAPNPLPAATTVWLEEMTWMDVRDAMKGGKKTIILSTGGIEPNGPWLALGKHNYVLRANCEATARLLGDALCAPIIPFVPEGRLDPPSGHMTSPGTISVTEETFAGLLSDIVISMKVHGFQNIVLIGDSGGNVRGMQAVADKFTKEWSGTPRVIHVREHYDYNTVTAAMEAKGILPKDRKSDGLHDDPTITMNMMVTDPQSVRWEARVKAGKATIDGVSIADRDKAIAIGKQIVAFRAEVTAAAIRKATGR